MSTSHRQRPQKPIGCVIARARSTRCGCVGICGSIAIFRNLQRRWREPACSGVASSAAETYWLRDRAGKVHEMRLRRHLRLNRDFPQFAAPLARAGVLRRGEFCGTPWQAVTQSDLLAEVFAALERDPRAIIAPPGAPIIP